MPKLVRTAPALRHLRDKSWQISRELPDVQEIAERSIGIIDPTALEAQFAFEAALMWQESSQMALGGFLTNIGIPSVNIFRQIVDLAKINVVTEITEKMAEVYGDLRTAIKTMQTESVEAGGEALETAIDNGVGIGVEALTQYPVVGWVVELAWAVGKFIHKIVKIAKADSYGEAVTIYPPSQFDRTLDNMVLNLVVLDALHNTRDWSGLFCPPRLGTGQGNQADYWAKMTGPSAREIFRVHGRNEDGLPMNWTLEGGWTGFVPGTGVLHQGVRLDGLGVSEIGSGLLPSSRNLLFWVWKELAGKDAHASPSMYCVHARSVREPWEAYIFQLHQWLYDTNEITDDQKQAIVDFYHGKKGDRIFGWGNSIKPNENEADDYTPAKIGRRLFHRQWAFLDSLQCAYVDESFAAIANSPKLRRKWKMRRRQLLEHPDRCKVDLEVVPDHEYRAALIESGANDPAVCSVIGPTFEQKTLDDLPDAAGGGAGIEPSGFSDCYGRKVRLYTKSGMSLHEAQARAKRECATKGGGMGLLMLGGVAAAALAWKKGWI